MGNRTAFFGDPKRAMEYLTKKEIKNQHVTGPGGHSQLSARAPLPDCLPLQPFGPVTTFQVEVATLDQCYCKAVLRAGSHLSLNTIHPHHFKGRKTLKIPVVCMVIRTYSRFTVLSIIV